MVEWLGRGIYTHGLGDIFSHQLRHNETPSNPNATTGSSLYSFSFNATVDLVLQNVNILAPNNSDIHPWHLNGHDFWVLAYGDEVFNPSASSISEIHPCKTRLFCFHMDIGQPSYSLRIMQERGHSTTTLSVICTWIIFVVDVMQERRHSTATLSLICTWGWESCSQKELKSSESFRDVMAMVKVSDYPVNHCDSRELSISV